MTLEEIQIGLQEMLRVNNETKETFLKNANKEFQILILKNHSKNLSNLTTSGQVNFSHNQICSSPILNIVKKINDQNTSIQGILSTILNLTTENLSDISVKDEFINFCNSQKFHDLYQLFNFVGTIVEENNQIETIKIQSLIALYPYVKDIKKLNLSPSLQYFAAQKVSLKP